MKRYFVIIQLCVIIIVQSAFSMDKLQLEKDYPTKYNKLYNSVMEYYSRYDFDKIFYKKRYLNNIKPYNQKRKKKLIKNVCARIRTNKRLIEGKEFFKKYKDYFQLIQSRTSILPSDIIAILNWGSYFGKYKGNFQILNVFISQYFFSDGKISDNGFINLKELLIQSKKLKINIFELKGTREGAFGIPQFLPKSIKYAKDGNNDGDINLNEIPDSMMSIANYLKLHQYNYKGREYAIEQYNKSSYYRKCIITYSNELNQMIKQDLSSHLSMKQRLSNLEKGVINNTVNTLQTIINNFFSNNDSYVIGKSIEDQKQTPSESFIPIRNMGEINRNKCEQTPSWFNDEYTTDTIKSCSLAICRKFKILCPIDCYAISRRFFDSLENVNDVSSVCSSLPDTLPFYIRNDSNCILGDGYAVEK